MVTIENPQAGRPSQVNERTAARLVQTGAAEVTSRVLNGQILIIKLTVQATDRPSFGSQHGYSASAAALRKATRAGYDGVRRVFDEELPNVPVVQGQKMVREEKSDRNWSYTAAVKRTLRCSDHKDIGRARS